MGRLKEDINEEELENDEFSEEEEDEEEDIEVEPPRIISARNKNLITKPEPQKVSKPKVIQNRFSYFYQPEMDGAVDNETGKVIRSNELLTEILNRLERIEQTLGKI